MPSALSISELYLIHAFTSVPVQEHLEHLLHEASSTRWLAIPATQSRKVGGWLLTPAVALMIGHAIHTSTISSHNAQVVRLIEAGKDAGRGVESN